MKKWVGSICIFATCCFMLTGCCMRHEWKEAACTEPKTCTKCGETEGEALGHTWADATCTEAKHCTVCGETEGEPSAHTLTEANYQQAAVCEVCGETVGEPLQADFEKYGLMCSAEQNTEYDITISQDEESMAVNIGKIVFSDYEIFDSDEAYEASEGYEWCAITMTMYLDSDGARYCNDIGLFPIPTLADYYCDFTKTYNESTDTYTLNYNGTDYTDVTVDVEILQQEWKDDILTFQVRYLCHVPKGYDGIVATVVDNSKLNDTDTLALTDQISNDNVFFRLK